MLAGIYWLTIIIPASWFDSGPFGAYRQRIQLQGEILLLLLPACLLIVNTLEILTVASDSFLLRLLKSLFTIVFTYLMMATLWQLALRPAANFFGPHRVSPYFTCALAVVFTICLIICLEILQRILFRFIKKATIARYIPRLLRMD
ncbi:hypothetical protein [Chitinophaga eiseniae]|uniref:hypothetical protein n=1 Tax=Chitinophaga eiseniae TaxID=634771 RepID=UPI0011783AB6|nr:hypothetical protein [Chitinophaga eiseniae]